MLCYHKHEECKYVLVRKRLYCGLQPRFEFDVANFLNRTDRTYSYVNSSSHAVAVFRTQVVKGRYLDADS
jgi:hypothetical protein